MNTYIAFYKDKQIEVEEDSIYKAQLKAAEIFKEKKPYKVTIVLAAKEGKEITHLFLE